MYNCVGIQAVVQPSRSGRISDGFANRHGEGDDVVFYTGLDLMDLRHVDFGASANRSCGILGNLASFSESLSGGPLDFQPLCELVRGPPNAGPFLARVAWDQLPLLELKEDCAGSSPCVLLP